MMERTALALEGGSLRCMFSAGVTDVMMERGLAYDGVFGVSAGALTGINYVSGQIGRTARVNLEFVNDRRYLGVRNLVLHRSIFNFDFLFGEISTKYIPFDWEGFEKSPRHFTVVATDCLTGQPMYCEKHTCGDIFAATRASASMPLLAPMVMVDGVPCLDGGCSLSIPYAQPLEEGYGKVVVVTTREHGYHKPPVARVAARTYMRFYKKYPNLIKALLETPRRYDRELDRLEQLEAQNRVFVIRPPKPITVSRTEKDTGKLQALYDEGRETCENCWDALEAYLKG